LSLTNSLRLGQGALVWNGQALLTDLADTIAAEEDPAGIGVFLQFASEKPAARHVFPVGSPSGLSRFTCCARYEPFWMKPHAGTRAGEVPVETQYLLTEQADGSCVLYVPLIAGAFRMSMQGTPGNGLELVAESGDPATVMTTVTGLFVAAGTDPYALLEQAARSVMARMSTGRLRSEKPLPAFVEQFGWCTWDAFYQDVSQEKVREGLESFARGGVTPKYLVLDDGWQSEQTMTTGERRLTSFAANGKFSGDLGPTVRMSKDEFGIETFLVWHAMNGYWGGVDDDALPSYEARPVYRNNSPGILEFVPGWTTSANDYFGGFVSVVPPKHIARFFQDYHRHLRAQGVDGVKVDSQATLESVGQGLGGRVRLMQRYHEALEGAAQTHFAGNLINCMSCANEMFYSTLASTLTRTSTDFWPNDPASHGLHLYTNAQVGAWFGEFVHPDWDMFQSGHPMGAYHAAGRAVGGCPVYVSDKPDAHDFDLLQKLVLSDGSVLRADLPGRPTRDCLFHDPTREDVLLKIFNRNGESGVLGVFNARYDAENALLPITGRVHPADVAGLSGDRFAVLAHSTGEVRMLARDDAWEIALPPLTAEVFTVVPIVENLALLGLADKFNSAGAVTAQERRGDECRFTLRDGGPLLAWCAAEPREVLQNGATLPFTYKAETHLLTVTVPTAGIVSLRLT
jgi:raffinose synthase